MTMTQLLMTYILPMIVMKMKRKLLMGPTFLKGSMMQEVQKVNVKKLAVKKIIRRGNPEINLINIEKIH